MEFDREKFRRLFPNLTEELDSGQNKVGVDSVRTDQKSAEETTAFHSFSHYMPDIIDFIRRCDNEGQAKEIIAYLENKGEIDKRYAEKLREQLKGKGIRSFGARKERDYYIKHGKT